MVYTVKFTTRFKKDLKLAVEQHKNIDELKKVVEYLKNGKPLPFKYKQHSLSGQYSGCNECHIEPDWLLVYQYHNNELILTLLRPGSHSDLFK